jgi:hypothetical protein
MENQRKCTYKINVDKSYAGCMHGVFCENLLEVDNLLVKTDRDRVIKQCSADAVLTQIIPIGQATLKRARSRSSASDRPNKRAMCIALGQSLKECQPVKGDVVRRRIPRVVRDQMARSRYDFAKTRANGRPEMGGNGRKLASWGQITSYVIEGPPKTSFRESGFYTDLAEETLEGKLCRPCDGQTIPAQEVRTRLMEEAEVPMRFEGTVPKKLNYAEGKVKRTLAAYEKRGFATLRYDPEKNQLNRNGKLSAPQKKHLQHIVNTSLHYSNRERKRLYRLISWSNGKVNKHITRCVLGRDAKHEHIKVSDYDDILQSLRPKNRIDGSVFVHTPP